MTCLGLSPLSHKRNCSVTFGVRVKKEGEGEKYKNKEKTKIQTPKLENWCFSGDSSANAPCG